MDYIQPLKPGISHNSHEQVYIHYKAGEELIVQPSPNIVAILTILIFSAIVYALIRYVLLFRASINNQE